MWKSIGTRHAAVTAQPCHFGPAAALPRLLVTRTVQRALPGALAGCAAGVPVEAQGTLVAGVPRKIHMASALASWAAVVVHSTPGVAGASIAVGVGVVPGAALLTPWPCKLGLAETPPRGVTASWQRPNSTAATQLAQGVVEVAGSAPITQLPFKSCSTQALSCLTVTGAIVLTWAGALAGLAEGSIMAWSALVTVCPLEVGFAHAHPYSRVLAAGIAFCPTSIAVAVYYLSCREHLFSSIVISKGWNRVAVGEVQVSLSTGIAVLPGVVGFAVTAASEVLTGAISEVRLAVATIANVWRVDGVVRGAVVSWDASLTVNASGVMLTVNANTSSFKLVLATFAGFVAIHLWVVVAVVGMAIAIARLAFVGTVGSGRFPRELVEARAAAVTGTAAGVVLAVTLQPVRVTGVFSIADICMAVADTAPSNADIFDAVVIPPGHCRVPQSFAHQVPKQSVCLQEAQSDVGGLCEIP